MYNKHKVIKVTWVLVFCLGICRSAEGGISLEDRNVPDDWWGQQRWPEYSRNFPPSLNCCFCLAQDGNCLWVGTSAGAVRWNLRENTYQLFKVDNDWDIKYAEKLGMNKDETDWGIKKARQYLQKWLTNAVENIIILSPGHVWVDTFSGAMIIHGDRKVVYPSVEDALTAIYQAELRPTLGKVVAMDKNGHLWYLKKIKGPPYIDYFDLLHYNGTSWQSDAQVGVVELRRTPTTKYNISDVSVDAQGNLWSCNFRGIYRRAANRWQHILKHSEYYGFDEMRLESSGTLWAFGWGGLARFTEDRWEVFEGTGRYKEFSLPRGHLYRQAVVFETPDGKLWFDVCFSESGECTFMCFDGKTFSKASFSAVAAMSNNTGQTFAASGDRLFYYDEGKWKRLGRPKFGVFGFVSWLGEGKAALIEDILVAEDDTVYVAAKKDGLLRYQNGSWEKISCDKSKQETKPVQQDAAEATAKMSEEQRFLMFGVGPVPEGLIQKMYESYIEGEGKDLIKATNDQLSKHIVNIKDNGSVISYYRLVGRDKKLANISLREMIKVLCSSGGLGEFTSMQIALFGPQTVDILLDIAKTGTEQERVLAIDSLSFMKDPNVVNKLLEMLGNNNKLEELFYIRLVRIAVASGKPEGMSILIQGATTEGKYQKAYQTELGRVTSSFQDVPDDWSLEKWRMWWQENRSGWQPSGDYLDPMLVNSVKAQQRLLETVAKKIESKKH